MDPFPQEAEMSVHDSRSPSPPAQGSHNAWVVGLSLFAGILMIIGGVFNAMEGIVALARNEIYVTTPRYLFAFDLTTWGWIQLILGIVVAIAGVGVITGQLWGRLVGITLAALSMLANFAFIPYYPLWSLSIIALNVFVIWALCVYNRDTAARL
jgi:hypothetical protein